MTILVTVTVDLLGKRLRMIPDIRVWGNAKKPSGCSALSGGHDLALSWERSFKFTHQCRKKTSTGASSASLNPVSSVENVTRGTRLSLTNQPLSALGSFSLGDLSVSITCSTKDSFQTPVKGPPALFLDMASPNFPTYFEVLLKIVSQYCTLERNMVLIMGVGHFALLGPEIKDFGGRLGGRAPWL